MLPADDDHGRSSLFQLQVTARSALGAMILRSGGLLIDDGWLRVLGSPEAPEMSLARVNGFPDDPDPFWQPTEGLVVAYDVLGGVFVLNGADPAGRPGKPGQIIYFAPDALRWEALGIGYQTWLTWLLSGRLEQFYVNVRWPDWREDVQGLDAGQGLSLVPPVWSEQAKLDLAATSRKPVPMAELLGLSAEYCDQLGRADPGFLGAS
jgi:hypothetical protein